MPNRNQLTRMPDRCGRALYRFRADPVVDLPQCRFDSLRCRCHPPFTSVSSILSVIEARRKG
jgi:hypothetical protein